MSLLTGGQILRCKTNALLAFNLANGHIPANSQVTKLTVKSLGF